MSGYVSTGDQAVASPTDTVLTLVASTSTRGRLKKATLSSDATPADNALAWILQRFTAGGTGSAVTPTPLDPGDAAAQLAAAENHTTEPTYTSAAILDEFAMNQRSLVERFYEEGFEPVVPATSGNGIGWQPVHSSFTGTVKATNIHTE